MDVSGYLVKSPCGELITKVEVLKVVKPGSWEPYWTAQAHAEVATDELALFTNTPGYSITPVKGAMEAGVEYLVIINDEGGGTDIEVGRLRPGRGAWLSDTFDISDIGQGAAEGHESSVLRVSGLLHLGAGGCLRNRTGPRGRRELKDEGRASYSFGS
jgi:hypothetical protein